MTIRMKALALSGLSLIMLGVTAGTALAAPAVPSDGQLTDKLRVVLNRAADHNARLAELADPSALRGADNIAALNDTFGWAFRWQVTDAAAAGEELHAQMAITLVDGSDRQGQVQNYPLTWVASDDGWKLTKDTICGLAQRFQSTC
jgi:hypothetical protein